MCTTTITTTRSMNTIAVDVHSSFCEGGWLNSNGRERDEWRVPTDVRSLRRAIEQTPRPRRLVMEEGPLADWLQRNLVELVDELVVCDPHRNALIAREGDKSDAIDWRKLAALSRGGFLKAVHHGGELSRSVFKQRVLLYHERVSHRVSEGNKLIWRVRQLGVFVKHKDLDEAARRREMLKSLPDDQRVKEDVQLLLGGYDQARRQVVTLKKELESEAKKEAVICQFKRLNGMGWIRAATFYAIVDTPHRFKSKQKLWKYMGIGLEKWQSGKSAPRFKLTRRCNRKLKYVILGAAKSAAASRNNPFADAYERWLDDGCSPRIARRNLARSLATVMWGLWKSGSDYDERMLRKWSMTV